MKIASTAATVPMWKGRLRYRQMFARQDEMRRTARNNRHER